jgi:hypothetical protein
MADLLDGFFSGNRWMLAWPHILSALLVPLVIVTVADRLIRHRR